MLIILPNAEIADYIDVKDGEIIVKKLVPTKLQPLFNKIVKELETDNADTLIIVKKDGISRSKTIDWS